MVRALLVGLVLASPALAQSREEYNLRRTFESLQGNWGVSKMTVAGRPAAAGERDTFTEDRLVKSNEPEESARLNIDVSGPVPKVEFLDRHGVTRVGLIQKRGNSIVMCLVEAGSEPPKDFKSTADNGAILVELTPAKP